MERPQQRRQWTTLAAVLACITVISSSLNNIGQSIDENGQRTGFRSQNGVSRLPLSQKTQEIRVRYAQRYNTGKMDRKMSVSQNVHRIRGGKGSDGGDDMGNYDVVIVNSPSRPAVDGTQGIIVSDDTSSKNKTNTAGGDNRSFRVRLDRHNKLHTFKPEELEIVASDIARHKPVSLLWDSEHQHNCVESLSCVTDGRANSKALVEATRESARRDYRFAITIDLEKTYWVQMLKMRWDRIAYPRSFSIQVSNSSSGPWRTVMQYECDEGGSWADHTLVLPEEYQRHTDVGLSTGRYICINTTTENPRLGVHSVCAYGVKIYENVNLAKGQRLRTGDSVVLEGLSNDRELNGLHATVVRYDEQRQRYTVAFTLNGRMLKRSISVSHLFPTDKYGNKITATPVSLPHRTFMTNLSGEPPSTNVSSYIHTLATSLTKLGTRIKDLWNAPSSKSDTNVTLNIIQDNHFLPGMLVEIFGLKANQYLNEKKAVISLYNATSDRYTLILKEPVQHENHTNHTHVALRPENVRAVSEKKPDESATETVELQFDDVLEEFRKGMWMQSKENETMLKASETKPKDPEKKPSKTVIKQVSSERFSEGDKVTISMTSKSDPLNGLSGVILKSDSKLPKTHRRVKTSLDQILTILTKNLRLSSEIETSSSPKEWAAGDVVEIHDLKNPVFLHLNGELGIISDALIDNNGTRRFIIDCGAFGHVTIFPVNLRARSPPPPSADVSHALHHFSRRPHQQALLEYPEPRDLAYRAPVMASSVENPKLFGGECITDGNGARTRWSSDFANDQFVIVDLGVISEIFGVRVQWEAAFASDYSLEISNDLQEWKGVVNKATGHAGWADHKIPFTNSARYVRLSCKKRATPYGFSIHTVQVFGRRRKAKSISEFSKGDTVEISNLEHDLSLNGVRGEVKDVVPQLGRVVVQVPSTNETLGVLPQKLYRIEPPHKINWIYPNTKIEKLKEMKEESTPPAKARDKVLKSSASRKAEDVYVQTVGETASRYEDAHREKEQKRMVEDIASESRDVRMGDLVRISNLTSQKKYNNMTARVGFFDREENRYTVTIEGKNGKQSEKLFVGSENLKRVADAKREDPVLIQTPDGLAVPVPKHEFQEMRQKSDSSASHRPRVVLVRDYVVKNKWTNIAASGEVKVTASSEESKDLAARYCVDGDGWTRWGSKHADNQCIQVEFKKLFKINAVALYWETAYAQSYIVETSKDGETWNELFKEDKRSSGGWADHIVQNEDSLFAKQIRVRCLKRGTEYGFSLHHIGIFTDDPVLKNAASSEDETLTLKLGRYARQIASWVYTHLVTGTGGDHTQGTSTANDVEPSHTSKPLTSSADSMVSGDRDSTTHRESTNTTRENELEDGQATVEGELIGASIGQWKGLTGRIVDQDANGRCFPSTFPFMRICENLKYLTP